MCLIQRRCRARHDTETVDYRALYVEYLGFYLHSIKNVAPSQHNRQTLNRLHYTELSGLTNCWESENRYCRPLQHFIWTYRNTFVSFCYFENSRLHDHSHRRCEVKSVISRWHHIRLYALFVYALATQSTLYTLCFLSDFWQTSKDYTCLLNIFSLRQSLCERGV